MRTERRHELQTNVLANWLAQHLERLRPYSKGLVLAGILVLVAAAVGLFLINDRAARMSAGWNDFFAASFEQSPERLHNVVVDHPGTTASLWAQLAEADIQLAEGIRQLYKDRASASELLNHAAANYEAVVTNSEDQPALRNSALFGLAQAYECSGELDKAIEYYERLAASGSAEPALVAQAQRRSQLLKDSEIDEFYAWFMQQKPVPPPSTTPTFGLPPQLPSGLGISDEPTLSFPQLPQLPPGQSVPALDTTASPLTDGEESSPEPGRQEPDEGEQSGDSDQ